MLQEREKHNWESTERFKNAMRDFCESTKYEEMERAKDFLCEAREILAHIKSKIQSNVFPTNGFPNLPAWESFKMKEEEKNWWRDFFDNLKQKIPDLNCRLGDESPRWLWDQNTYLKRTSDLIMCFDPTTIALTPQENLIPISFFFKIRSAIYGRHLNPQIF